MNKKIGLIGGVIITLLIIMIFMSKTIYTMNMPVVTGVMPKNEKIKQSETTSGVANWANINEIYSSLDGKIENVLVTAGDKVTKGQEIATFSFNKEDATAKLKQFQLDKAKIALDIESINIKIKSKKDLLNLPKEDDDNNIDEKEELSNYEIEQQIIKIDKAKKELETIKVLYESGVSPKNDVTKAEIEIKLLEDELNNLTAERDKKIKQQIEDDKKEESDKEKKANEKEKEDAKLIKDINLELANLNQDLKLKNIDMQNIYMQEEQINNQLTKFETNQKIIAPNDGIIVSIPIKTGQYLNANSLVATYSIGAEFEIAVDINLNNNYIFIGDECLLKNINISLKGKVKKITPSDKNKKVLILVESDKINSGESFDIKFSNESKKTYNLIPNQAVHKDTNDYYVYTIKKRDGILGEEFYITKKIIEVETSDNENTAIKSDEIFFDPIVSASDKVFYDKSTVILSNEGDFYAK